MPTFSNIDLEESATVTARVGAVTIDRGGVLEQQEILHVGDPDSSSALAAVTNTAPDSTRYGVNVRIVSGPSSAADLALTVSSLAGAIASVSSLSTGSVRVTQSSAVDLTVTVAGYSTTVNVSSLAGTVLVAPNSTTAPAANDTGVIVRQVGYSTIVTVSGYSTITTISTGNIGVSSLSTGSVRVNQSSAADLNVTVAGYSTITTVSTGSVRVHQSTAADLNVTVAGYSTIVTISTGNIGVSSLSTGSIQVSAFAAGLVSSGWPEAGTPALLTEAAPIQTTFVNGQVSSARSTIVAAISTSKICVTAFTLSLPMPSSQTIQFVSGGSTLWQAYFHSTAASAGVSGAVTAPQYLFRTASNASLEIFSSGASASSGFYSVTYYEG